MGWSMGVFNGMFPVLEGKEDLARAFAAELVGPRRADFVAAQGRANTTRETWTLQQTPMGSFVLVWFEGDVEKAFADLATDASEFGTWMRAQVKELSGVDMSAPSDEPLPEVVLDWSA
jgi:hypothetical protein